MQHRCKLKSKRRSGLVTYESRIEPRSHRIAGLGSLSRLVNPTGS